MTPLETYLRELRDIRALGAAVEETAYYPALASLLTEVGKKIKPKVRCIMGLQDLGAGFPDGGLFTEEQFDKKHTLKPLPGQLPSQGVIEVKPVKSNAWVTAEGEQVSRYWGKYRQVLVTNYRDFVLVGQDAESKFAKLESFQLAESEKAFWTAAVHPRSLAEKIGARFEEYLLRVMRHAAQLAAPEDVAWFLASYARDAKARIEGVELAALATVRSALEEALGLKFEGRKGEHFFRSSLVQTLFYGVFSAWVLWAKQNPPTSKARFDWYTTARYLRVPMISKLFFLVADPQELETLKLTEVLDWAALVLNRVDRRSFFDKFQESHAVQFFYEPFLRAFDPELRKELGVWYTPPEIVKYMVERVDTVLRQELSLADGLADKRVYVLDPCCGTGSYLVEVLDRIHRTLKEKNEDALLASDLKDAARNRVVGFEILPAPFVVSHLQLGLLLQNLGAPLSEKSKERVGVYLTNALTGWEPPKGPKTKLPFPELQEERDASEHVKREVPILVILGNPPYNAFAGVSPQEEQGLVEPYKDGLITEWRIKKFNLDDLYVRFFRVAERRIAEMTGKGIVSFISNHSWVSEPSFVVMRQRLLASFDRFWVENMHGNRKISEYAPDGRTSETIFAIPGFSVGIQQGVVVSLWVKSGKLAGKQQVLFRDDLNAARAVERRAQLLESLKAEDFDTHYRPAHPNKGNRYSFRPEQVSEEYGSWPKATELSGVAPFNGPIERRSNSLIVFPDQRSRLALVADFLDPERSDEEIRSIAPAFMESSGEFNSEKARKALKGKVTFDKSKIVPYPFKPFDVRLAYLDASIQPLFSRPSPELLAQRDIPGNAFFITRDTADKFPEGPPFYFSRFVCDYDCISGHARHFPLRIVSKEKRKRKAHPAQAEIPQARATTPPLPKANLSGAARQYIKGLGFGDPDLDPEIGKLLWLHAVAIGYSPAYLSENADGIRRDWPRIPLPDRKEALLASAALGNQVSDLLDTDQDVSAIHESSLQKIAAFTLPKGTTLDEAKHFAVTAGWGHAGKDRVTMPGKGKLVDHDYTEKERASLGEAIKLLGEHTSDVYMNEVACWSNIPLRVWEYTIGGYQVIKKWLSYREERLLGHVLSKEEVRYVQEMARRIAALLLLEPALDANYQNVKAHTFPWKG